MTVTIIRHGETAMNSKELVCGITDIPLTEKGILQAKEAANRLVQKINSRELPPVTNIISSPLIRAKQTAECIAAILGIKVTEDHRLTEQNYGKFEGKSRLDPEYLNIRRQFAVHYPGGESALQTAVRTYALLNELKQKKDADHYILVTHGGTYRIILTYFNDMTNSQFADFRALNCDFHSFFL